MNTVAEDYIWQAILESERSDGHRNGRGRAPGAHFGPGARTEGRRARSVYAVAAWRQRMGTAEAKATYKGSDDMVSDAVCLSYDPRNHDLHLSSVRKPRHR